MKHFKLIWWTLTTKITLSLQSLFVLLCLMLFFISAFLFFLLFLHAALWWIHSSSSSSSSSFSSGCCQSDMGSCSWVFIHFLPSSFLLPHPLFISPSSSVFFFSGVFSVQSVSALASFIINLIKWSFYKWVKTSRETWAGLHSLYLEFFLSSSSF